MEGVKEGREGDCVWRGVREGDCKGRDVWRGVREGDCKERDVWRG